MDTLKINLNEIKQNEKVEKIKIDDYTITTNDKKDLVILKDDLVIVEYKNNAWFFNGKSINSMWECLQNHFEAIQKIIKELQK